MDVRLCPLGYEAKFTYLDAWTHFGLFRDGTRIATFGDDLMPHIAEQMYWTARAGTSWKPTRPLNPIAAIAK